MSFDAVAAMPVQRLVSPVAVLLASATLRLADCATKPVAPVVVIAEPEPENAPPTPMNKLTLVRSIVSRSTETTPLAPRLAAGRLLLAITNPPLAIT